MSAQEEVGLVLTGGGARGAYQAGVLTGIAEIMAEEGIHHPFPILSGSSAGSINASYLAAYGDDILSATYELRSLWENIATDQVFKTDAISLAKIAGRWIMELSSGSLFGQHRARALLDTAPLRELLTTRTPFNRIHQNIESGAIKSLAVTAVNYSDGTNVTFYDSCQKSRPWQRTRRRAEPCHITADHIMASAAIPLVFPPIQVGEHYYGDGSLRNYTPLSPAIKLGASKLLVIGVRRQSLLGQGDAPVLPTATACSQ